MLGYAFMGKAHSRAFREASYLEPALQPRLVSISGRTAEKVEEARRLHGWEEATTDWREQVADERVQLFDNGGPTTSMPSRRSRRRETASMSSARSRSGGLLRRRTRSGARRRRRRRAHVRLQLPLRAGRAPGARDRRVRRPRRALPLPRPLPPVLGCGRTAELALRQGSRGLRSSRRPRRPHRRSRPLPDRRARPR